MLEALNICKSYQGREVLKDVSLTVEPGEIVTVIGPSGSGKTTLLKSLSLLEPADSGSMVVDGHLYDFPLPEGAVLEGPWPKLTVVFQSLFLWPHLTLRENILLPTQNIAGEDHAKNLAELVDWMEMENFMDRYPNQVSGGQRQRAALARAIMLRPRYLLLDEITSALDVIQVSKIVGLLPVLARQGIGMVLVTHLLNFARETTDKVVFMHEGRVAESGGKEILNKPKTKELRNFLQLADKAS